MEQFRAILLRQILSTAESGTHTSTSETHNLVVSLRQQAIAKLYDSLFGSKVDRLLEKVQAGQVWYILNEESEPA